MDSCDMIRKNVLEEGPIAALLTVESDLLFMHNINVFSQVTLACV